MYIPQHFEETRVDVMHALMRSHPFATLVTGAGGALDIHHLPTVVDTSTEPLGTLCAHVARANPVWKTLDGAQATIVFQGAQAYISPNWYPSKHAHGKAVPTWNYAIVHARVNAHAIQDGDWLLQHLTNLTDQQEASQAQPWKLSDAPEGFIDKMRQAVVGLQLDIVELNGKWKTSQNRPKPDRLGVVAGLLDDGSDAAKAMAALVMANNESAT
ncbi:MAG: FMN-binding negative transcriptional regulator [Chromatiales bacterium]|jgi:transcriptional regulator|nr:FMN-binding negative transcriptional regulator [Chromatiales bacterium]